MLAGNVYLGLDATPSPEYRRDLEGRHGAGVLWKAAPSDGLARATAAVNALAKALGVESAPLSKAGDPKSLFDTMDRLAKACEGGTIGKAAVDAAGLAADMARISRDIDLLKASDQASDQVGRPEHMSPTEWLRRKAS